MIAETESITSIRTDKATLEQILKSAYALQDDPTINLDSSGLFFKMMNSNHVALIDVRLPNTIFQSWNVKEEKKFSFDAKQFLKIVRAMDKTMSIVLEIFEDEIKISNREEGTLLKIREGLEQDTPLPKLNYDSIIRSDAKSFKALIKKVDAVSDYISFNQNESKCLVSGKGDNGSFETDLEGLTNYGLKSSNDSESIYSIEYLNEFLKSVPNDQMLEMEYSSIKPCRFSTKINNLGMIQFYLAPGVEN